MSALPSKQSAIPTRWSIRNAVGADGEILGVRIDVIADAGAYSSYTPTATSKGLIHALVRTAFQMSK